MNSDDTSSHLNISRFFCRNLSVIFALFKRLHHYNRSSQSFVSTIETKSQQNFLDGQTLNFYGIIPNLVKYRVVPRLLNSQINFGLNHYHNSLF